MTEQKKKLFKQIRHFTIIVLGNMIASSASVFFIVPNGLAIGGTTGLGIFIGHFISASTVSLLVLALNVALYLIGVFTLGKKFAISTLLGTFLYPLFMQMWELIYAAMGSQLITDDMFLASTVAGILLGFGIGLVVREGSSTGGTDIPPLILHKYFGLPVSIGLWAIDIAIVFMLGFVSSIDIILYGMITVIVSTIVLDAVTMIGMKKTQVKIISEKYKEIREMILGELQLGVTVLYGQTGFLQEKCHMLLTVVNNRGLVRLKNAVQKVDPNAFLMISVVSEVHGRGYTSERIYLDKNERKKDLHEVSFGEEEPSDSNEK